MPEPAEAPGNVRHGKAGIYPQEELTIDCECIDTLNAEGIELLRTAGGHLCRGRGEIHGTCSIASGAANFAGLLIQPTQIC